MEKNLHFFFIVLIVLFGQRFESYSGILKRGHSSSATFRNIQAIYHYLKYFLEAYSIPGGHYARHVSHFPLPSG